MARRPHLPGDAATDAADAQVRLDRLERRTAARDAENSAVDFSTGEWSKFGVLGVSGGTDGPEARIVNGRVEFSGESDDITIPGGVTSSYQITTDPIPAALWPESYRYIGTAFFAEDYPTAGATLGALVFTPTGQIWVYDAFKWAGTDVVICAWDTISYRITDVAPS